MTLADRVVVMKTRRGAAGRHARPRSMTSPANTFVASFIGNPAMNLMEGRRSPATLSRHSEYRDTWAHRPGRRDTRWAFGPRMPALSTAAQGQITATDLHARAVWAMPPWSVDPHRWPRWSAPRLTRSFRAEIGDDGHHPCAHQNTATFSTPKRGPAWGH